MFNIPIDTAAAAIGAAVFLLYRLTFFVLQAPAANIPNAKKGRTPELNGTSDVRESETASGELPSSVQAAERCMPVRWWHALLLVAVLLGIWFSLGRTQHDAFADCSASDNADGLVSDTLVDFAPRVQAVEPQWVTPVTDSGVELREEKSVPHKADAVHIDAQPADAVDEVERQVIVTPTMDVVSEAPVTVKVLRQVVASGTEEEYMRSAYYGTLMVGTPPQAMTVVFDTGSGQLVLPSAYCNSPTCKAHRRYRRSKSSTGRDINFDGSSVTGGEKRDAMSVSYGTGDINGVAVEDIICMSGATGRMNQSAHQESGLVETCVNMRFLAATYLSEDPFADFEFDGIVGLGMASLSQNPDFNFLHVIGNHLKDLGSSHPSTFAVFLAKHGQDSEIALGGWNSLHAAESLSFGPVHDPDMGHWIIPIRALRIDGRELDLCKDGTCRAAVDTGTSLLSVPTASFMPIFEGLRHAGSHAGHCMGHGPQLQIDLGHFTLVIGPKEYAEVVHVQKRAPKKVKLTAGLSDTSDGQSRTDVRCFPALMAMDFEEPMGPKLYLLGEPVLRKYYTVFDAERQMVGLARAVHRQALNREALLMMAPEVEKPCNRCRSSPTMFDIFRWRMLLRRPRWAPM